MGARSLASAAAKAHIPKLRRLCSPSSHAQSTSCALQNQIPVHHLFTMKNDLEAEKALHTGEAFVKRLVLEKLNIAGSSKKEVVNGDDEPIFFAHRSEASDDDCILTAFTLGDDGNVSPKYHVSTPFPIIHFPSSSCCGISNGIAIFVDSSGYALWNPKTSEVMYIPRPPTSLNEDEYPHDVTLYPFSTHIWFDDKTQDYKVIQVYFIYFDNPRIKCRCVIDLYSLRTNSWKKFSVPKSVYVLRHHAFINGVFYANARKDSIGVIFSFDSCTGALSYLPEPPRHMNDRGGPLLHYIVEYKGLLSVLSWFAFPMSAADRLYEHWVMMDGLWHRLSVHRTRNVVRPSGFWKNDESLFFESENELVVFDSVTQKVKYVDGIYRPAHFIYPLIPFSESSVRIRGLVGLDSKEEVQEEETSDEDDDEVDAMLKTVSRYGHKVDPLWDKSKWWKSVYGSSMP